MSDFAEIMPRCPRCGGRLTGLEQPSGHYVPDVLILECRPCDEANARGKPAPANDTAEQDSQ